VDRWLLNTLPTWALVLLVVGGAVCVGVGGFLLMRKFVPSLGEHSENRSLSSAFSISSSLFSFVLAFTIGQLYQNYTRANADAKQEATQLAQVLRASAGLPEPLAAKVRIEALSYAYEVRNVEWDLMKDGGSSIEAWQRIDEVYGTMRDARTTASGDPFYGQTLARLNDLVTRAACDSTTRISHFPSSSRSCCCSARSSRSRRRSNSSRSAKRFRSS